MTAIVERIGCKLNVFNEDGVYRRDNRGEESLAGAVTRINVIQPVNQISPRETGLVGKCEDCHTGSFALSEILHHIDDVSTCTVCHLDPKPAVEDSARWLVCTGCHDSRQTHYGMVSFGDLHTCADGICHHTVQREIHILD